MDISLYCHRSVIKIQMVKIVMTWSIMDKFDYDHEQCKRVLVSGCQSRNGKYQVLPAISDLVIR